MMFMKTVILAEPRTSAGLTEDGAFPMMKNQPYFYAHSLP